MRFGITALMGAFIGGAATMYFVDAQSGGRRRALVRDKAIRAQHSAKSTLEHVEKDFENRARGTLARVAGVLDRGPVDDETLVQRVRAKLGHVCSHPSAIDVRAKGKGVVELKGPILARERIHVLAAIALVPGVRMIDDDLETHLSSDVAQLRGDARRGANLVQRHWNPTTRFLTGATGAIFVARGLLEDSVASTVRLAFGSALIAAAAVVDFSPRRAPVQQPQRREPFSIWSRFRATT